MRGRNVNKCRQFTNIPPVHQARLTKHNKAPVSQEKNFGEKNVLWNVHPPPCVAFHVSYVRCHFFFWQNGGACRGRVCYQRSLPRLVYLWHSKEHYKVDNSVQTGKARVLPQDNEFNQKTVTLGSNPPPPPRPAQHLRPTPSWCYSWTWHRLSRDYWHPLWTTWIIHIIIHFRPRKSFLTN